MQLNASLSCLLLGADSMPKTDEKKREKRRLIVFILKVDLYSCDMLIYRSVHVRERICEYVHFLANTHHKSTKNQTGNKLV